MVDGGGDEVGAAVDPRAAAAGRLVDAAGRDGVSANVKVEDLKALLDQIRSVASGVAPPARITLAEGVERYDMSATVWRRAAYGGCPDGDWVLEVSGTIRDTHLVSRHPQPATCRPEDVPGLGALYEALEVGTPAPDAGWTVRDPAYLAGLSKGLHAAAGIIARHAREAGMDDRAMMAEIEGAVPRTWDAERHGAHPRHPEVDDEDVDAAYWAFRSINPGRSMRHATVRSMLEATFSRRASMFQELRDANARLVAALFRHLRTADKERDPGFVP